LFSINKLFIKINSVDHFFEKFISKKTKSGEMHKCLSRWKIENKVGYKIGGKKMRKFEIGFFRCEMEIIPKVEFRTLLNFRGPW
jgi:hypothetical protein